MTGSGGPPKANKKRKVLLLGSGISKSLSPEINNKAYRELGLEMEYDICEINEEKAFDSTLKDLAKDPQVIGFNITIPFKERILPYLAIVDPVARIVGAVNLVVVSNDRKQLSGYNTDVDGVLASLSKLGVLGRAGQAALVLGAGGAARACVYALLSNGFNSVKLLNRTEGRAVEVAGNFSRYFPEKKIGHAGLTAEAWDATLRESDLIINTVPLTVQLPFEVNFGSSAKNLKCLDLNYRKNPPVLRAAKKEGIPSIDGSLMLVEQAARSFEILTGISAPRKTMVLAAKKQAMGS
jgi:shikimate dehydrogenase